MLPIPVYDADGVTLHAGDCLDVMPMLKEPVDLVVADLPYATTPAAWDKEIDSKMLWHCYAGLTGPRTPVILFGSGLFAARMTLSNAAGFRYDLVWNKDTITGGLNAKKMPLRAHEVLLVFYDQAPYYDPQMVYTGKTSHSRGTKKERSNNHYGHYENTPVVDQAGYQYPRSILTFKRPKLPKGKGHPNVKPVALLEWIICSFTKPGDLILDNTCGSATALVAARTAGRRAIGIEKYPPWIELAASRLASGSPEDRW
jgi:site-specific DNA-methyltransferase (adenine-specific)